jgi:Arc/MetJ-type ribon-helix-helix transcriptional regulator
MKVSVSLPGEDVAFLDSYAREQGLDSRSAALQRAVRLLRVSELGASYESAWEEWNASLNAEAWDATAGDGLPPGGATIDGASGEALA